jgi:hypothetical protein
MKRIGPRSGCIDKSDRNNEGAKGGPYDNRRHKPKAVCFDRAVLN